MGNNMNMLKSMVFGVAVGTALTAAGTICMNENKTAQKAIKKAKASKRIITRAGENVIKEITD